MAQRERVGRSRRRWREAAKFRFRSGELNSVNFAAEPNFPPTLSSRLSFPHLFPLGRSLTEVEGTAWRAGEREREQQPLHARSLFLPLERTRMAELPTLILRRHNWTTSLSLRLFFFLLPLFLLSIRIFFSRETPLKKESKTGYHSVSIFMGFSRICVCVNVNIVAFYYLYQRSCLILSSLSCFIIIMLERRQF